MNNSLSDDDLLKTDFGKKNVAIRDVNILYGFLFSFIADGVIQQEEKELLEKWRNEHNNDASIQFLKPIFNAIDSALSDNVLTIEEVFTIIGILSEYRIDGGNYSNETIDTQLLLSFCQGITCDGVVNKKELELLNIWIEKTPLALSGKMQNIKDDIKAILSNNYFSEKEAERIRDIILDYISVPNDNADSVSINGKNFVLSGQFAFGSKQDVTRKIVELGGHVTSSVGKKTDYLVVGGTRSNLWKYGAFGTKVEKAKRLQEEGLPIIIVSEGDFINSLTRQEQTA